MGLVERWKKNSGTGHTYEVTRDEDGGITRVVNLDTGREIPLDTSTVQKRMARRGFYGFTKVVAKRARKVKVTA